MRSSLIIADLHLVSGEVEKTKMFVDFCQNQAAKVDQLFILGDLFNTWLGDDLSIDYYPQVIQALKTLSQKTQIKVMSGNRDFLMGQDFEAQTGCEIIKEPYFFEQGNRQFVLIHGDALCTDDTDYQRLKKVLQHPLTKFVFLRLPKKIRLRLAGQLRQKSVKAQQYKSREIMDVNPDSVNDLMQKYPGADLIHGHTHRQNTHEGDDFRRYVLGDWSSEKGNAIKIDSELTWLEINA